MTNSRKLYEEHLGGDKWKFVVTLDEAWIYLSDTNKKRAIYSRDRGTKPLNNLVREFKETFSKGFMVVAGYSYNGKLKLRRVGKTLRLILRIIRSTF